MKQEDLSFQDFKLILNNSPNIRLLSLVGEGEPLIHPEFFRMVNHAKQKNIIVFTTTNGSFLSDKNIAMLCDSKIDCISISIDSTDPKQFAESRAGGGLDNIWDGIESLILHRDRLKLGYPKVAIKGTLFKHSEDQLTKIIAEARKRGMDYVEAFQTLSQKKTHSELYPADKRDMLKDCRSVHAYIKYYMRDGTKNLPSINEIIAHNEEHDSDRMRKQHQKKAKTNILRGNCDIGWTYSLLSGDITPCCAIKSPVNKEFNLKEDSLGSILKNKNYENIRFNLWNGLFLKDCEGCGKIF